MVSTLRAAFWLSIIGAIYCFVLAHCATQA